MVKVERGTFSGQRTEGYHQLRTDFGTAAAYDVRRAIPTDNRPTIGNTPAQKKQKEEFKIAGEMYKHWDYQQHDFFRRVAVPDIKIDKSGRQIRRILTGQRFAIHDIIEKLNSPTSPYKEPLPFCICAVYANGEPAPGHTLKITTDKLPQYHYEESNDEYACFPTSSVSPEHERYKLVCGLAEYGPLTAERIHRTTSLCVEPRDSYYTKQNIEITNCYTYHRFDYTFNFSQLGIPDEKIRLRIRMSYKNFSRFTGLEWSFNWDGQGGGAFVENMWMERVKLEGVVEIGDGAEIKLGLKRYPWNGAAATLEYYYIEPTSLPPTGFPDITREYFYD